jgi:hypothetical protein
MSRNMIPDDHRTAMDSATLNPSNDFSGGQYTLRPDFVRLLKALDQETRFIREVLQQDRHDENALVIRAVWRGPKFVELPESPTCWPIPGNNEFYISAEGQVYHAPDDQYITEVDMHRIPKYRLMGLLAGFREMSSH